MKISLFTKFTHLPYAIITFWGRLIFPSYCPICHRRYHGAYLLCPICRSSSQLLPSPICQRCGTPLNYYSKETIPFLPQKTPQDITHSPDTQKPQQGCLFCHHFSPLFFDQARSLYPHTGNIRTLILLLKYKKKLFLAHPMAHEMSIYLQSHPSFYNTSLSWVITSVPQNYKHYLIRTYNQAEEIARALAHDLQQPYYNLLDKSFNSSSQTGQRQYQRFNLKASSFSLRQKTCQHIPPPEAILLIDDTMTTGTTINRSCALLKKAFPQARLHVLTLTRTLLK